MKILTLLGIRPDIIRMHKLIALLDDGQRAHGYRHVFAHTGQHFDYALDGVFYQQLGVRLPDINLNVGRTLQERGGPTGHAYQTALLFEKTHELMEAERPDAVLYLGDTNSVVSSLIVARHNIPVIHIEAGGRSFDWRMPEEKCRTVIDHLSDVLYCYLPRYRELLLREGIADHRITVIGNIIHDALDTFLPKAEAVPILSQMGLAPQSYALVTLHREENTVTREALEPRIHGLARLAKEMPVVFPVMPRVRAALQSFELQGVLDSAGVRQTEPLGFFEFLRLEQAAHVIVTDSGTVQEEACILGVPCLVSRRSTERPETLQAGATVLSEGDVYEGARAAMALPRNWDRHILNPMGGSPSQRVFDDLMHRLKSGYLAYARTPDAVLERPLMAQAYGKFA